MKKEKQNEGGYAVIGFHLLSFWNDQKEWSQKTFGDNKKMGPLGPLHHLLEEVNETIIAPYDIMEYADMFILILDAARRAGFSLEEILEAAQQKLDICKKRKWGIPDKNGKVKSIKD